MDAFTPTMNEAYREYADRLLQHHRFLGEGKDRADETLAVEEEMTELWDRLDPIQRKSLSGLGSDLTWVRRGGAPAPRGPKLEDVSPADRQALQEARNASDWHGVLHQLRVCAPSIPLVDLARLRAETWSELGLPQIASVFDEFLRVNAHSTSSSPRPSGP
jgi:hypothetical protein